METKDIRYGGFWRRFFAGFLDTVIVSIIMMPFLFGIQYATTANLALNKQTIDEYELLINLISLIIFWLYYALQYASKAQATLGMRAIGLKIVGYDYGRISFARATGRHFAEILSSLTLGIGYLMIAFTSKKQGLHDFIAKTYILRT